MIGLEWNEAKRLENLAKHGIDFRDAGELFADPDHVVIPDHRRAYGEERFIVLGKTLGGRVCVLVMTPRAERVRVISLRPANARERRYYEQGKDHQGGGA
jgi:uncharacterized protein